MDTAGWLALIDEMVAKYSCNPANDSRIILPDIESAGNMRGACVILIHDVL